VLPVGVERVSEVQQQTYAFAYDELTVEELEKAAAQAHRTENLSNGTYPNEPVNSALVSAGYDGNDLLRHLSCAIALLRFDAVDKRRLNRSCEELVGVLDRCPGKTLQVRWLHFEKHVWPGWLANDSSRPPRAPMDLGCAGNRYGQARGSELGVDLSRSSIAVDLSLV
jgi:hypothetical protein